MAGPLIKTGTHKTQLAGVSVGVRELQGQPDTFPRNRSLKNHTISNYHCEANKSEKEQDKL